MGLPLWSVLIGAGGPVLLWHGGLVGSMVSLSYAALLLTLASAVVGSFSLLPVREAVRSVPLLLLAGTPWAVLAYLVLQGQDLAGATWRVRTEPFAGGPFLVLLVFLVGLNGAALGHALRRPRVGFVALVLFGTVVMLGIGFLLVRLGLRAVYWWEISFGWWAAFQSVGVWLLGLGHWIVLSVAGVSPAPAPRGEEARWTGPGAAADALPAGPPAAPGRTCGILATAYAVLVVYGSLVPLEYRHRPFEEAVRALAAMPYLDLGVANRADLVANLLLFIPLAFLTMGALTREGRRPGRWLMAGLTMAGAAGLAVGVEFLQLYFLPRTVAWNDVLAECVGAAVGTGLWLSAGRRLARWWRRVRATVRPAEVAGHLLTAYVIVFFLYQLFPFDVILSAEELAMEVEEGKILLHPLAGAGSGLVLAAKVLAFLPVGFWVVVRMKGRGRPVLAALVVGTTFSFAIEVLQVFVFSRYSSATDVLAGAAGAVVGGALATRLGPAATKPLPRGLGWRAVAWLLRLGLTAALLAVVVWGKWAPMDAEWPRQGVPAALVDRLRVPFYHQYWNSEFEAAGQLLRDVTVPAILAMLLVSLLPAGLLGRRALGAVAAGGVAAAVELGQIVFPPHVPDATTAVLAVGGAVAGVYLYGPFVRAFIRPGGEPETEMALEEPT